MEKKPKIFSHFDNSFRRGIIVAASVRHFFSFYSQMNTHQLLSSRVLHKPRAMARTAWTVDCDPWENSGVGALCHPLFIKKFNIKNLLVNVFCTHTKDSSRHKKQWRPQQGWQDLHENIFITLLHNRVIKRSNHRSWLCTATIPTLKIDVCPAREYSGDDAYFTLLWLKNSIIMKYLPGKK